MNCRKEICAEESIAVVIRLVCMRDEDMRQFKAESKQWDK